MKAKNQKNRYSRFWKKYQSVWFWAIFAIVSKSRIFFKNPALPLFYLHSPLTSCKISEKSFERFLRKQRCQPANQPTYYYQQHRSYRTSLMPVQKKESRANDNEKRFSSFNIGLKCIILNSTEGNPLDTIMASKYNFNIKIWKYRNLQKFVAEIFIIKISLLLELTSDIFEFIEKPHSLRITSQFRIQTTKYDMETEKYSIASFSKRM